MLLNHKVIIIALIVRAEKGLHDRFMALADRLKMVLDGGLVIRKRTVD